MEQILNDLYHLRWEYIHQIQELNSDIEVAEHNNLLSVKDNLDQKMRGLTTKLDAVNDMIDIAITKYGIESITY